MSIPEMVFSFNPNGCVIGLHFDEFDLGFLGNKEVYRASEIFFNENTQSWSVKLPQQDKPFEVCTDFDSYDEARNFEVLWLQECMKVQTDPYSKGGEYLALMLREGTLSYE